VIPSPSPDPGNEDACRRAAAQLQHDHGRWLVMWGCYTRSYIAFPLFTAQRGIVLTAASPGEMTAKIRRTEGSADTRVPPPRPGGEWQRPPQWQPPQEWQPPQPRQPPQARPGPQEWPGPQGRPGPPEWPGRRSLPPAWGVSGG
jgi:hypothetical protein